MLRERLDAQGLSGEPFDRVEHVVGRILAVQSQDRRGMSLAIRSRSRGLKASDVDRALGERSMVVTWLNRGTLHLVLAEDYAWLHSLTAPRTASANARRLSEEGVSPALAERGVEAIVSSLAIEGPRKRDELRDHLDRAGIPTAGQALVHLIGLAALRGLVVRGPVVEGQQLFVLTKDWLGRQPEVDIDTALAELARRYLTGHGPATDRDLAKWAGVTLGQARKGLRMIGSELVERDGLVDLAGRSAPEGASARLLGAFDPILHGWKSREWIIPAEADRAVVTTNGIFRPTILAGERIVGTWSMPGGKVELAPFGKLDRKTTAALDEEANRVKRYLAA